MTVCMQCALEAFVSGSTEGPAAWSFDETPEAHTARLHADQAATRARRAVLEVEAMKRIARGELFMGVPPPTR